MSGYERVGTLELQDTGGNNIRWEIKESGDNALTFGYPGELVRVSHAGNVGIGTTDPQSALHVSG